MRVSLALGPDAKELSFHLSRSSREDDRATGPAWSRLRSANDALISGTRNGRICHILAHPVAPKRTV